MSVRRELRAGLDALRRTPGCVAALGTNVTLHLVARAVHGAHPGDGPRPARAPRRHRSTTPPSRPSPPDCCRRRASARSPARSPSPACCATFRRTTVVTVILGAIAVLVPLHQYTPTWVDHRRRRVRHRAPGMAMVQSVFGSVGPARRRRRRTAAGSCRGTRVPIGLAYGVGLLVMGTLSDRYGLRTTFVVSGLVVATVVVLARRSTTWTNAIDGVEPSGARAGRRRRVRRLTTTPSIEPQTAMPKRSASDSASASS